jgi:hypothetical protein
MKEWFRWAGISFVVVLVASYAWIHARRMAIPANAYAAADAQTKYTEQDQAAQAVTVTGPMADYMLRQKPGDVVTIQAISSTSSQPVHSYSHQASDSDHVTDNSPVGTSTALLHKTFDVANLVDLPFQLPAHASTPQLRGTYRSYLPQNGSEHAGSDDAAAVEFMVLTEAQFADLLNGRPGDAQFSADASSNGEVNFTMPPTFGQPAKYYIVFRNSSRGSGKKVVQADFRIDF